MGDMSGRASRWAGEDGWKEGVLVEDVGRCEGIDSRGSGTPIGSPWSVWVNGTVS